MVAKILRTMSTKFDYLVIAIEETKNIEKIMIDELQGSLEAHELKLSAKNLEKASDD